MNDLFSLANELLIIKLSAPRVLIATVSGFIVGMSRERQGKSAGIKTNVLISVGACLFTIIAQVLAEQDKSNDLSRIIAQVVSGVGFLGAGTIFRAENRIYGLTSAAFVWVVAAIGILSGLGLYLMSLLLALGSIFVVGLLNHLEVTKNSSD